MIKVFISKCEQLSLWHFMVSAERWKLIFVLPVLGLRGQSEMLFDRLDVLPCTILTLVLLAAAPLAASPLDSDIVGRPRQAPGPPQPDSPGLLHQYGDNRSHCAGIGGESRYI